MSAIIRDADGQPVKLLLDYEDIRCRQLDDALSRQCWATPRGLFSVLHEEWGFTVDACALPHNAKLPRFWTPEQDGLRQSWVDERVYCNPPFDNIEPWIAKAYHEYERHPLCTRAVLLLPVRSDQRWWHRYAMRATCIDYFVGRVQFDPPPGVKSSSNRDATCLVIFDARAYVSHWRSRDATTGRLVMVEPEPEQLALGSAK